MQPVDGLQSGSIPSKIRYFFRQIQQKLLHPNSLAAHFHVTSDVSTSFIVIVESHDLIELAEVRTSFIWSLFFAELQAIVL